MLTVSFILIHSGHVNRKFFREKFPSNADCKASFACFYVQIHVLIFNIMFLYSNLSFYIQIFIFIFKFFFSYSNSYFYIQIHVICRQFASSRKLEKLVEEVSGRVAERLDEFDGRAMNPRDIICSGVYNILTSLSFGETYVIVLIVVSCHYDLKLSCKFTQNNLYIIISLGHWVGLNILRHHASVWHTYFTSFGIFWRTL